MEDFPTYKSQKNGKETEMLTVDKKTKINTDEIVEKWWMDFIHNSPVSRDTEVWNHLYQAKNELKKRLRGG